MPSICLYLQAHLPFQLNEYSIFQVGKHEAYWDEKNSQEILNQVADQVYIPANKALKEAIDQHEGKFKIALSLSGTLLEQLEKWRPDALESFQNLVATGCVEILSETYYHSISFLVSRHEFFRQVILHREKIWKYFSQDPRVFSHTDLIYNSHLAYFASQMGYKGLMTEGAAQSLHGRSPNLMYSPAYMPDFALILRNSQLSEDITLRFSDSNWSHFPLSAQTYTDWLTQQYGKSVHLGMPYETFGSYHKPETGILDFMRHLPNEVLSRTNLSFSTPSELVAEPQNRAEFQADEFISAVGPEKNIQAWQGNDLQKEALIKIFELETTVLATEDAEMINAWSILQSSDYFQLMSRDANISTRTLHRDISPLQAYRSFMNIMADFQLKLR